MQNYQVSLKQYLVILLFHMRIQEDLEGELRIQSEVIHKAFFGEHVFSERMKIVCDEK